jgi:hypothetical protein
MIPSGDAEVLLMGGQAVQLDSAEGSLLEIAAENARLGDANGNTQLSDPLLQQSLSTNLVGACNQQLQA